MELCGGSSDATIMTLLYYMVFKESLSHTI